jgi:murein DD-endopeptidase MepM/ murein hydrolase activator NlpD
MHILITHGSMSRTRALHLSAWQLAAIVLGVVMVLLTLSGAIYHFIFLKAAREGWPVVSHIVRFVVRDEFAQRDRFMRENLDAIATRLGEIQAKMVRLEAAGERVSGLAGLKPEELRAAPVPPASATPAPGRTGGAPAPVPAPPTVPVRAAVPASAPGQGGPYLPRAGSSPSLEALQQQVSALDAAADQRADVFLLIESRLLERRLQALLVPSSQPVNGPVGSGFGFRADPFTGRSALHTGLDFPGDVGTPITAAAGGVVLLADWQPEYGQTVEIEHGNGLVTRYAHVSKVHVRVGDLVKRGQRIADIGSTGRSTGPHLHFEVLVDRVPQDPMKFLSGRVAAPPLPLAAAMPGAVLPPGARAPAPAAPVARPPQPLSPAPPVAR